MFVTVAVLIAQAGAPAVQGKPNHFHPPANVRCVADSFGNYSCSDGSRVIRDSFGHFTVIPGRK
jgi:hypothetical protein